MFARVARSLNVLVLLLTGFLVTSCRSHPVTLVIGRDEIQRRMESKFPVEKQVFVARVVLEHPEVILREGSDRIGIKLHVRVNAPLLTEYTGTVAATGKLAYRREEKAFYLREPTIDQLDIDGLRPEHAELVRAPAEAGARAALETVPVYRLEGKDLKEVGARELLQSVAVRDGKVHATLALP